MGASEGELAWKKKCLRFLSEVEGEDEGEEDKGNCMRIIVIMEGRSLTGIAALGLRLGILSSFHSLIL